MERHKHTTHNCINLVQNRGRKLDRRREGGTRINSPCLPQQFMGVSEKTVSTHSITWFLVVTEYIIFKHSERKALKRAPGVACLGTGTQDHVWGTLAYSPELMWPWSQRVVRTRILVLWPGLPGLWPPGHPCFPAPDSGCNSHPRWHATSKASCPLTSSCPLVGKGPSQQAQRRSFPRVGQDTHRA